MRQIPLSSDRLRGVNFGGWLLMEGYILHGPNMAESVIKEEFAAARGKRALTDLEHAFRTNFITPDDFTAAARTGANVIRLPFNARLLEGPRGTLSANGMDILRGALRAAQAAGIGVILDMHAACAPQNADWHGDSRGKALLWSDARARGRSVDLWGAIAAQLRDEPALIGYDVLNEPVLNDEQLPILIDFYRRSVRAIRAADTRRVVYLEGSLWAQRIDFLSDIMDDGLAVSVHFYHPLEHTFNFTPGLRYPGTISGVKWSQAAIRRSLEPYARFGRRHGVRVYVGEFGINWRDGNAGEDRWLDDTLSVFESFGFDYTYWTWKAVANSVFPDGLLQQIPNGPFVRREGPLYGWQNYTQSWPARRAEITSFWCSDSWTLNRGALAVLKPYFALNAVPTQTQTTRGRSHV